MADQGPPYISDELLAYLTRMFPDRCPQPGTPTDKVWFQAGQASVVTHLRIARERSVDHQLELPHGIPTNT